jgi:hypothetical protein
VVVQLASLYWGFPNPPDPSILRPVGSPTLVPAPVGTCVPGGGCGTATATFTAVGAGSTQVSASRTTCGEALLCTGGNGSYAVHVVVQG